MRRLILLATILASHDAMATTWAASADPLSQPQNPMAGSFMTAFTPDASWGSGIQVWKVSTQFLHRAPENELAALIHTLQAKHVSLAMEGLMIPATDRCGRGVESYSGPDAIPQVAARVKRLGGEISYVAMDEPVWFGNGKDGPRTCRDPVESIAQQMVPNVRAIKAAFPAVKFGDIEPLNNRTLGRIDLMLQFAHAFQAASGEPIAFIDADIIWQQQWRPQLIEWKQKVHAARMSFGVIFDGDPQDRSDAEWTGHALERYRTIMADPAARPDDVIFQSWHHFPTRLVPDSDPNTLTGLVKRATSGG